MALKTAFISEHQTRFLDCVVGDQSHVQVPAEVSGALSSFSYDANCFYSTNNGKKLYRKKSRSKAKVGKKKADKVFPEEFFSDTGKEHHLSSSKCSTSHKHTKTPSSGDLVKEDLSPTLRLSHSCVELKNLSGAKGHSREEVHECSSSEISNCKAGSLPKCIDHKPQCFSGNNSQDICRSVSSNNSHKHVPKSRATSVTVAKKKRSNINNTRRKEQSRLTWKKCQGGMSNENKRETMSLPDHANFDSISQTSSVPSQQAALSCDELAVTSNFSAKQKKAVTKSLDADDMLNRGICVDISVESCQQVAEGLSSEYKDSLFGTKPIEMIHVVKLDESNGHQKKFGKSKNNGWKATRGPSSKSYRRHNQPFPFQPQHVQSKEKVYSKDTSTFDPPHPWMKLPTVKPVEEKHIQNLMNEWSDATCSKSNMTPRVRRQDITQHQSARKWIPVCKKNTSIPETSLSAGTNENIYDNSPMEKKEDIELEGDAISNSIPEAPVENISSNLLADNDIPLLMEHAPNKVECPDVQSVKNCTQSVHVSDGFLHHADDSQFVEQAFISSYRMQLASEGVHRTTGYPLAEFERLLVSATPTIDSSVVSKACDRSFSDMLSGLILSREQTPNISLHSVLDWYEEPGNYGLKVDVNRSHIQEGCVADTESFHAHFVPLLSAIQLFGHNYSSSSFGKRQDQSLEAHGVEASLQTPLCGNPAIDAHDITKPFNATGPSVLSNAELLFEFFESEQPQRRKPLHNKIVELASEGTINNQVFGDPSKLHCTSLVDLHPASWFSVAWYPIYRIPEGKMRAAFLTYHSLGYLVQRRTTNNFSNLSQLSLAVPVIGLQSYSAQAELWFSLNMESESSLGQMTSAVLKERLRTLEENANFFARGSVFKDHVMVTNRQPDYEFFMSRKGKPLYL